MSDGYKAKYKRSPLWIVEKSFFARGDALAFARVHGGWVVDEDGIIVADFRARWRRWLAGVGARVRLGWLRMRSRKRK